MLHGSGLGFRRTESLVRARCWTRRVSGAGSPRDTRSHPTTFTRSSWENTETARLRVFPLRNSVSNWDFPTKEIRWAESHAKPARQVYRSLAPRAPLIAESGQYWCASFVRFCV